MSDSLPLLSIITNIIAAVLYIAPKLIYFIAFF